MSDQIDTLETTPVPPRMSIDLDVKTRRGGQITLSINPSVAFSEELTRQIMPHVYGPLKEGPDKEAKVAELLAKIEQKRLEEDAE